MLASPNPWVLSWMVCVCCCAPRARAHAVPHAKLLRIQSHPVAALQEAARVRKPAAHRLQELPTAARGPRAFWCCFRGHRAPRRWCCNWKPRTRGDPVGRRSWWCSVAPEFQEADQPRSVLLDQASVQDEVVLMVALPSCRLAVCACMSVVFSVGVSLCGVCAVPALQRRGARVRARLASYRDSISQIQVTCCL